MQKASSVTINVTETPPPGKAILNGQVTVFSLPVPSLIINLGTYQTQTDFSGSFSFEVPTDSYNLQITHVLFEPYEESLDLLEEKTYTIEIPLALKTWAKIAGIAIPTAIILISALKPAPTIVLKMPER